MVMNELDILWRLGLALVLSSAIGLEREVGQKSAGLRTYSLVGVGSAVFMLVSIFGFSDSVGHVQNGLDPSRVAAQIVSGIGKGMLPRSRFAPSEIRIVYFDGRGLLREALSECARRGFSISDLEIKHESDGSHNGDARHVTVDIEVRGQGSIAALASELNDLDGVVSVFAGDANQLSY